MGIAIAGGRRAIHLGVHHRSNWRLVDLAVRDHGDRLARIFQRRRSVEQKASVTEAG
jgi:hypothetical protein